MTPTAAPDPDHSRRDAHLSRVARGSMINLAGAGFAAVGGFALVVIVSRLLDTRTSGEYFSATSAFLIVVGVSLLGVDAGLSRFVLRFAALGRGGDVPLVLRAARRPVLVLSVAAAAVVALIADPLASAIDLDPVDGPTALRVLAGFLPVAALSEVSLSGTRAFGTMHVTVLADRLLRTVLQAVGVLAAALADAGLVAVVLAWGAPYLVTAVLGGLALRRSVRRPGFRPVDPARTALVRREFWAFTWPRSIAQVIQMVIQRIDIVLVAALIGAPQAAVYTVATRFVPLGQFVARAIQQALQPRMSEMLSTHAHDDAEHVLRLSTAWTVLATWPFYVLVAALAPAYLTVFGDEYVTDEARLVVAVMAVGMMIAAGVGALDTVLLMAGRSALSLSNSVLALVTDLVLAILLIPRWGIAGAATAWAVSVSLRGMLAVWQVRHVLAMSPFGPEWAWASGAVAGLLIAPVGAATAAGLPPAAVAGIGLAGLTAVVWVVRRPLQLRLLSRSLRRRRV